MTEDQILSEIERHFPFVEKPENKILSFHPEGCGQCADLREDLEKYDGPELPHEAIRWIHMDMSCLSSQAWLWVFPSYLRDSIARVDAEDQQTTQFLIFNLCPSEEFEAETTARLTAFSSAQIYCLIYFLDWIRLRVNTSYPGWNEADVDGAIRFLQGIGDR